MVSFLQWQGPHSKFLRGRAIFGFVIFVNVLFIYFILKVGGGGVVVKPPSSPQRLHRGKDSNNISTHFVFNDDDCYKQGAREGGREGGREDL